MIFTPTYVGKSQSIWLLEDASVGTLPLTWEKDPAN